MFPVFSPDFINLEIKDGSRCHGSLKLLDLETWRQRLLQLVCLLLVVDHQSVEEPGAPNLELNVVGVLLDLDAAGVLPPGLQEEVLEDKNKIYMYEAQNRFRILQVAFRYYDRERACNNL